MVTIKSFDGGEFDAYLAANPGEAKQLLNMTAKTVDRERDLRVLHAAMHVLRRQRW